MRELGIDLSSHNVYVNNKALKSSGATFAIIKTSEGTYYVNDKFNDLKAKCSEASINRIAYYHYLIADSYDAGINEADFCLKMLSNLGISNGSTIFADAEISKNSTDSVKGFLATIKNAGYQTGFYTYKGMLGQYNLSSIQEVADYTWLASYPLANGKPASALPDFNYFPSAPKVNIWQYTDNLLGFNVDGNISVTDISGMFSKTLPEKAANKSDSWIDKQGLTWHREKGTFTLNRNINLRWGANTYSSIYTQLPAGSVVKYDAYAINQGYVWLRQPRNNGVYCYLVGRDRRTGEAWGEFK